MNLFGNREEFEMYRCKYGDAVEYRVICLVIEDIILYFIIAIFLLPMFKGYNPIERVLIPFLLSWQSYAVIGGCLAVVYLIYLIGYLCSKSVCTADENEIIFHEKEKDVKFSKKGIGLICTYKIPFPLVAFFYDAYGGTEFVMKNSERKVFCLFPHTLKKLKKLGYPVKFLGFFRHNLFQNIVGKDFIFYKIIRGSTNRAERMVAEFSKVGKIHLNYGDGVKISMVYETGEEGNLQLQCDHRERISEGRGAHQKTSQGEIRIAFSLRSLGKTSKKAPCISLQKGTH